MDYLEKVEITKIKFVYHISISQCNKNKLTNLFSILFLINLFSTNLLLFVLKNKIKIIYPPIESKEKNILITHCKFKIIFVN